VVDEKVGRSSSGRRLDRRYEEAQVFNPRLSAVRVGSRRDMLMDFREKGRGI